MKEKKNLMDRVTDFANTIAAPISKFGQIPAVAAIQDGLASALPGYHYRFSVSGGFCPGFSQRGNQRESLNSVFGTRSR